MINIRSTQIKCRSINQIKGGNITVSIFTFLSKKVSQIHPMNQCDIF
jgi:hypothetical protein